MRSGGDRQSHRRRDCARFLGRRGSRVRFPQSECCQSGWRSRGPFNRLPAKVIPASPELPVRHRRDRGAGARRHIWQRICVAVRKLLPRKGFLRCGTGCACRRVSRSSDLSSAEKSAHTELIRTYRSRSASRMMFEDLATSGGSRPAWFDFEKDCKRLLEQRGLEVVHQAANRGGDGGVDLYASDRGGRNYVVQCKCWSAGRAVRPATVRTGRCDQMANLGDQRESHGILITTSTFSPGAVATATELGIELIDGSSFSTGDQGSENK